MKNIILCMSAFAVANFGTEYFLHDIPSYGHAAILTWYQLIAVATYHYFWSRS